MVDNHGRSDQNNRRGQLEGTPRLSDDQFYLALASTQRRRLLYVLLDEKESTVGELATVLAGWEATETGTMGKVDDRDRLVIELKHVHLPRLVDAGVVTHDPQRDTVRIESLDPLIEDLLSRSVESDRPPRS